MSTRHIEAEWKTFEAAVVPSEAGETQRECMRMAFFGGASALFALMLRSVSNDPALTEADEALMNALDAEMTAFAKGVGR